MHLEMTGHVLETAEEGTFETRQNHFRAGHIVATVVHNLKILDL